MLLVGRNFHSAQALMDRLERWGFRCHLASDMQTAFHLLSAHPFDLVLSNTHLPDGTGFGLLGTVTGLPVAAFLYLPVETDSFWLPACDDGKDCLRSPALRPSEFASAFGEIVRCLAASSSVN